MGQRDLYGRRRRKNVNQDLLDIRRRCSVADSPLPRLKGLLGRSGLDGGEGLLIRPTSAVHTWFMRFPIDVVFLDGELRVLRIVSGLKPWRAAARRRAKVVLERAFILGHVQWSLLLNAAYLVVMAWLGLRIATRRLTRMLQP